MSRTVGERAKSQSESRSWGEGTKKNCPPGGMARAHAPAHTPVTRFRFGGSKKKKRRAEESESVRVSWRVVNEMGERERKKESNGTNRSAANTTAREDSIDTGGNDDRGCRLTNDGPAF